MMGNLISFSRLKKIRYTIKTQSNGVLKVAKGCSVHLKGVVNARLKSSRRVTFVDIDYHDE